MRIYIKSLRVKNNSMIGSAAKSRESYHSERACAINIDGETIIITGGRNNGDGSRVVRKQKGSTEEWPPLVTGRSQHACGSTQLEDNSTVKKSYNLFLNIDLKTLSGACCSRRL